MEGETNRPLIVHLLNQGQIRNKGGTKGGWGRGRAILLGLNKILHSSSWTNHRCNKVSLSECVEPCVCICVSREDLLWLTRQTLCGLTRQAARSPELENTFSLRRLLRFQAAQLWRSHLFFLSLSLSFLLYLTFLTSPFTVIETSSIQNSLLPPQLRPHSALQSHLVHLVSQLVHLGHYSSVTGILTL